VSPGGPPLSAARALDAPLAARPDAEAVVARGGRLTYAELDTLATTSIAALGALGVRPGDRVAVSLGNDLPIVGLFHAAMRLGAVWVGVNRQLAPPEKAYILRDCGASVFLGDREMVDQVAGRSDGVEATLVTVGDDRWAALTAADRLGPPAPDPLAPAAIAYTSGTTGFPKGAVHSQHNLMVPGAVLNATRGYGPSLKKADCFPLTILNLQVLSTLLVAQAGGTAVVMDRVDPLGIAEWLAAERPTHWNGAPAMLYGLAADDDVPPDALASLDEVWTGGSACPAATLESFGGKFGVTVATTYGLTEAPTMVAITPPGEQGHDRRSGRPLPHLDLRILDEGGRPAAAGTPGEICVAAVTDGPWAHLYRPMLGYWRRVEATERALAGGVLHTGDLGRLDGDGYLHVAERQSSVILRGGANVYPAEVERVIDEVAGVAASCVVGVADERLGERVMAVVELDEGAEVDPDALRAHLAANLARYKVPESIVLGRLPRNAMGKISRRDVVDLLGDARPG